MTKKRIAEIYRFLASASMKRMNDEEKIALIRLLRAMKPVFTEIQDAMNDALEKAKADMDDESHIVEFINMATEDLSGQTCEIVTRIMTAESFDHLCLSNDWTFAQIDELEAVLVK